MERRLRHRFGGWQHINESDSESDNPFHNKYGIKCFPLTKKRVALTIGVDGDESSWKEIELSNLAKDKLRRIAIY
jgi:hypothetical protein